MATWKRQPQEEEGNYLFSGSFIVTKGVMNELSRAEIQSIYFDLKQFVKEKNGICYFQVYKDENNRKLYFIDQLDKKMIASGEFKKEDNHCTLLFNHEY